MIGETQVSSKRAGGKYRVDGTNQEEIVDKSDKWSGEDMEVLDMEEEAETAGGGGVEGGVIQTQIDLARVPEVRGTGELPGGAAAGGGDTWGVTSKAVDEAGVEGRHGAKQGER